MKHFRHRLTIQAVTQTRNEFGEPVETWATAATVWGLVTPGGGGEVQADGTTKRRAAFTVEVWYLSTLTTKHQLVYDGKTLAIDAIENVGGRDRKMKLTCMETA